MPTIKKDIAKYMNKQTIEKEPAWLFPSHLMAQVKGYPVSLNFCWSSIALLIRAWTKLEIHLTFKKIFDQIT